MNKRNRAQDPQAVVEIRQPDAAAYAPVVGEATIGLLEYLVREESFPQTEIPRLREESINVLSGCAAPRGQQARRTGLVCGYVQSGKTASMEAVSALARDNGYRILILMAGVTTILVEQSSKRVQHLKSGAGGYDWVMLNNPKARDRADLEGLVREWRTLPGGSPRGRTLFITVMKQANHLSHLATLLQSLHLRGIPAIIFDDEADQASLNTRPLDPRPSTIYLRIGALRNALPHHTLLQYTATPQAPLLISRIDSLSADFAEVISPGLNYAGGQMFFRARRADLIKEIPQHEILDDKNLPDDPPDTLKEALALFFVGVASRYAQGSPTGNRSMLVHPHHTKPVHAACLQWVQSLQRDWSQILANETDPDRPALMNMFQAAHTELSRTEPQLPTFDAVSPRLIEAAQRTAPRLVNSNDGREVQWDNAYAYILVGGEKLGRGYTVHGLTVTYMPRGPGVWNADTIQQRARFFGYHSEYLGLCRVFLHPDVADAYEAYLAHEEDVRTKIAQHRGQPLQNLKRAFILDADLRPTRHNVLARLYQRPLTSEWFEQRWPHATPDAIKNNQALTRRLAAALRLQPHAQYSQHQFADTQLDELLQNFLSRFECPDDRDETPLYAVMSALGALARERPDTTCRVFFMSHGTVRGRQQDSKVKDIDLMQGRSSAGAHRYPGDRDFCTSDRPTLQIHMLKVGTGTGGSGQLIATNVPTLALRLPDELRRQLQDFIVQPDH
jgi:hypothetical protein